MTTADALYSALPAYADRHGRIGWPQATLAALLGLDRSKLARLLRSLVAAGRLLQDDLCFRLAATETAQPSGDDRPEMGNEQSRSQTHIYRDSESTLSPSHSGGGKYNFRKRENILVSDWSPSPEDFAWAALVRPEFPVRYIYFLTEKFQYNYLGEKMPSPGQRWRWWVKNEDIDTAKFQDWVSALLSRGEQQFSQPAEVEPQEREDSVVVDETDDADESEVEAEPEDLDETDDVEDPEPEPTPAPAPAPSRSVAVVEPVVPRPTAAILGDRRIDPITQASVPPPPRPAWEPENRLDADAERKLVGLCWKHKDAAANALPDRFKTTDYHEMLTAFHDYLAYRTRPARSEDIQAWVAWMFEGLRKPMPSSGEWGGWVAALVEMPYDLLPVACRAVLAKQRQHWRTPPVPGDLLDAVAEHIETRKRPREGVKTLMLKIRTALGIRLMPDNGEYLGPPDRLKRLT